MYKSNDNLVAALDTFASFPINHIPETNNYDDAFVCGEIVSIIMKLQLYDDKRLEKYLILWAKLMGIGETYLIFPFFYSFLIKKNVMNSYELYISHLKRHCGKIHKHSG